MGEAPARRVERAGSLSGIAVLILLIVGGIAKNRNVFAEIEASVYIATIALGAVGMVLGWVSARLFGLGAAQRRAIAFETGIQNSPLAIAIVLTSFAAPVAATMVYVPLLYAFFVLVVATVLTLAWGGSSTPAANESESASAIR
ncbi:MAG: hypothetical protein R3A47_12095 [Polyangiales bacterium]